MGPLAIERYIGNPINWACREPMLRDPPGHNRGCTDASRWGRSSIGSSRVSALPALSAAL